MAREFTLDGSDLAGTPSRLGARRTHQALDRTDPHGSRQERWPEAPRHILRGIELIVVHVYTGAAAQTRRTSP